MKKLSSSNQKILKIIHLISASIWMTCVFILCILVFVFRQFDNWGEIYMYNKIFHLIDIKILTPAAVLTLLTGLIYSIFTNWGFFRHGWIIYKWVITLMIIVSGTFYLGPMVTKMLNIAKNKGLDALSDSYYIYGLYITELSSIIIGILLISACVFSIYKPWKKLTRRDR